MKPVLPKIFALLAVSVSATLLLSRRILSSSSSHSSFQEPDLSSSPLLVFIILNTIVLTVLLGRQKPNCCKVDLSRPSFVEVAEKNDTENEGDNDVKEHSGSGRSDGYDGDEDDMSGSDDEISWGDEDGTNSQQRRIEEFIKMVDERWCIERLRENNHKECVP